MIAAPRQTTTQPLPAMKLASISAATAVGLSCLVISSCNSADPSAISESQKALAEAMAKNIRLSEEIAALKAENEEAKADLEKAKSDRDAAQAKPAKVEEPKMPSPSEIEGKLDQEVAKLKEEAKQKYPGAKVESLGTGTWDVTGPTDSPFTCKAKVALKEANGTRRTLYWTGSASLKGDWKFKQAENLDAKQPDPQEVAKTDPATTPPKADDPGEFVPPTLKVAKDGEPVSRNTTKDTPRQPTKPQPPPQPEKPKPKYDINFDNPVMGPGSR